MSHPADFNYHLLKENTDGKTVYRLYITSKNITSEKLQKEINEYKRKISDEETESYTLKDILDGAWPAGMFLPIGEVFV